MELSDFTQQQLIAVAAGLIKERARKDNIIAEHQQILANKELEIQQQKRDNWQEKLKTRNANKKLEREYKAGRAEHSRIRAIFVGQVEQLRDYHHKALTSERIKQMREEIEDNSREIKRMRSLNDELTRVVSRQRDKLEILEQSRMYVNRCRRRSPPRFANVRH